MKFSTRTAAVVFSAAFCGAAAVGITRAFGWSPFPGLTGQTGHPARANAAAAAAANGTLPVQVAANSQTYRDGSYSGPAVSAYYGLIRVRVGIQGGRIASIHVLQYPSDNGTSRYINSLALPYLRTEVIQAQNVFVNMVSGATLSSDAFLRSTYAALRKARA
jgi:uncharacterized protein with FMN-binding domain